MGEAQQLSNSDFRKLLLTPRPGSITKRTPAAVRGKPNATAPVRNFKPNPPRPTGGPAASGDEEPKDSGYRDRAAERRLGLAIGEGIDANDVVPGDLSYEESKYLGGDVEHTHLVRGLDYALLNRMRSDQQPADVASRDGAAGGNGVSSDRQALAPPSFRAPMARVIYRFAVEGKSQAVARDSERFLPRRCAFVYDVSHGSDPAELPTTLLRAKEDCPALLSTIDGSSNAAILDRMAKIMAYISGGKKRGKKRDLGLVSEQPQANLPAALLHTTEPEAPKPGVPEDSDEDIFGDAGRDYVAERRKPGAPQGPSSQIDVRRAVFGDLAKAEPGTTLPRAPEVKISTSAAKDESCHEELAAKELRRKAIVSATEDDGYAECYPSYNEMAGAVYDSEDDDGRGIAKPIPAEEAKAKLGKREAAKEAAKAKGKQASELAKLQQIFEEKGYGNAKAFGNNADKEGNRPSKPSLKIEAPVKKRRI